MSQTYSDLRAMSLCLIFTSAPFSQAPLYLPKIEPNRWPFRGLSVKDEGRTQAKLHVFTELELEEEYKLTISPICGWNSNFMGGQKTLLYISIRRCLSLLASRFSTAFSMASRPSCFDCSRFSSADKNVLSALLRLAWYPRSQHCWKNTHNSIWISKEILE